MVENTLLFACNNQIKDISLYHNNKNNNIMATILDAKVGDTIKVSGIKFYESLNKTAVTCGKITSESPVIKILSLEYKKRFKCNPCFIIGTISGDIEIVTRQKIEIL